MPALVWRGRLRPRRSRSFRFRRRAAPGGIAAGPDGNLWFTESNANKIGRITTAGVVTEFSDPHGQQRTLSGSRPARTATCGSPRANANKIGRITTAGVVTEFPIPTASVARTASRPARTATSGSPKPTATRSGGSRRPASSPSSRSRRPASLPRASRPARTATSGSRSPPATQIGRITTAGVVTEFPIPHGQQLPFGIAAGPDGNLWFTEFDRQQDRADHDGGVITEFADPTSAAALPASRPARTATCGSPRTRQQDRADHDRRRHHRVPNPDGPPRLGRHRCGRRRQPLVCRMVRHRPNYDESMYLRRDDEMPGHRRGIFGYFFGCGRADPRPPAGRRSALGTNTRGVRTLDEHSVRRPLLRLVRSGDHGRA